MKSRLQFMRVALALSLLVGSFQVQAVCLDPNNLNEYYFPTIEEEIKSSDAIVIGTIVETENLSEDPDDPGGWTAFLYTVEVTEVILGDVAELITLRAENDSGGYRPEAATSHIYFLQLRDEYYSADPCGNTTEMPDGVEVVAKVKALLSP